MVPPPGIFVSDAQRAREREDAHAVARGAPGRPYARKAPGNVDKFFVTNPALARISAQHLRDPSQRLIPPGCRYCRAPAMVRSFFLKL